MRFLPKHMNQAGDTLVEVLIAIAIISSVLAGAFLVSQKSAMAVRSSQEQGEMLQLLQGQIEMVRRASLNAAAETDPIYDTSPNLYFCMDEATKARVDSPGLGTGSLPALEDDTFADYEAPSCKGLGSGDHYNIAISYNAVAKVFTFVGRWDGPSTKKQEVLYYRVYPGAKSAATTIPVLPPNPIPTPDDVDAAIGVGNPSNPGDDPEPIDPTEPPRQKCYEQKGWTDPTCWVVRLVNDSSLDDGVILKECVWDWGDGTKSTYNGTALECKQGTMVSHQYTPQGTEPNKVSFNVTLTNTSTDAFGSEKTSEAVVVRLPH